MAVSASAKTVIDSFREAVQDLLVPELKALRVSVEALKTEMQLRDEKLQGSIDGVRTELRVRAEAASNEAQLMRESIQNLAQKLDFAIDIRERLAALEARLPRQ